jgi:DNA polymerase II large subunit
MENFAYVKNDISKILFLGDILVSFGDFLYNSKSLAPSGYVEEWWAEDVQRAIMEKFNGNIQSLAETTKISFERLKAFLENPFANKPTIQEAIALSLALHVPLHPSFTFFWSNLRSIEELEQLRSWLLNSNVYKEGTLVCEIVGDLQTDVKQALETICLPHKVSGGKIIIDGADAYAFVFSLGYEFTKTMDFSSAESIAEVVSQLAGVEIREKAGTFVGARMGRPEKAKRREMKPLVHILFPVGLAGGAQRDIVEQRKKSGFLWKLSSVNVGFVILLLLGLNVQLVVLKRFLRKVALGVVEF